MYILLLHERAGKHRRPSPNKNRNPQNFVDTDSVCSFPGSPPLTDVMLMILTKGMIIEIHDKNSSR